MANYKVLATWDISIQNLYKDITLIQQGISCKLNISLRSISRVVVNYKVENEYVTDLCTIDLDNNKVIVPFKKNVLEVGTHALELVCHMKNGDVLPTPNYYYTVTKSLDNTNDITEEDAYPVLIGMIQELTKNEAIIQANEEARANAEMYRELNEDERQNAEAERKANENTRINNETTRQSNESDRQQYETQRRVEEDERLTDEQVRVNAENIRIANENERLRKEIERQNAEELRQIAYNSSLYGRMDEAEEQLAYLKENKLTSIYGFKGDGSVGDTDKLQNAINNTVGVLEIPQGEFIITKTIKLKANVILRGVGCGASLQGKGYQKSTCLKPNANFEGDKVIDIDPKNINDTTVYTFGNAIQDLTIDCIDIADFDKTIINIRSLTNSETFRDIRILNYKICTPIVIGQSENSVSRVSDGLVFSNIYTLPLTSANNTINPVLKLEGCNEISFRDCKFQSSSGKDISNSKSVYISAQNNSKVAGITFDSCSFTNSEKGLFIESNDIDGEGVRWVRVNNCTFEGVSYGIWLRGTKTRPTQFCYIGGGNRFITTSEKAITLGSYSTNNTIIADEVATIDMLENSRANMLIGGQLSSNKGIENVVLNRIGSSFAIKPNITEWQTTELKNGWVSNTSSRTYFAFRKDNNYNKVVLKGYLTGGSFSSSSASLTLPEGYIPTRNHLFTVSCNSNKVCNVIVMSGSGDVLFVGGTNSTDFVCLDGIEFYLD